MTSTLANALDRIALGVSLLPPPATPNARPYIRLTTLSTLSGTSGHRTFWFEIPSGGELGAFGVEHSLVEHAIRMRVRLSTVGVPIDELPGWISEHAAQLLNRCNRLGPVLGVGIRSIRASSYATELLADINPETGDVEPGSDIDLIVSLLVRAEETDG